MISSYNYISPFNKFVLNLTYNKLKFYFQKSNSFNYTTEKRLNTLKYFDLWPSLFLGKHFIFKSTCIIKKIKKVQLIILC